MKINISFFRNIKQKMTLSEKVFFWTKNIISNFLAIAFLVGLFSLLSFIPIFENKNIWTIIKNDQWYFYAIIIFFSLLSVILMFFYNFFAFILIFFQLIFFLFCSLFFNFLKNDGSQINFILPLIFFSFLLFSLLTQLKILKYFFSYFDRKIVTHKLINQNLSHFRSLFIPYFLIFLLAIFFYFSPLFLIFIQKFSNSDLKIPENYQNLFLVVNDFNEIGRFLIIFMFIAFLWNIIFFAFFCYLLIFITKEKNHLFLLVKKIQTKTLLFFPSKKSLNQEISFLKTNFKLFLNPFIFFLKGIKWKITRFFRFRKNDNYKITFFYRLRFFWLFSGLITFFLFLFVVYPEINNNHQIFANLDLEIFKNGWERTYLFLLVVPLTSIIVFIFFNLQNSLTFLFFNLLRYGIFFLFLLIFHGTSFLQKKEINYFIYFFLFLLTYQMISNFFFYQNYKKGISFDNHYLKLQMMIPLFLIPFIIFLSQENELFVFGIKLVFFVIFYQLIINYYLLKLEQQISKRLQKCFSNCKKNWKKKIIAIKSKNGQEEIVKNVNDWS